MTEATYPGTYSDKYSREALVFRNDGTALTTTIRGVHFGGKDFDSLEAAPETPSEQLATFSLNKGDLCGCQFTMKIAVPVALPGICMPGTLHAELELGPPTEIGRIEHERLKLTLTFGESRIASSGASGLFEIELLEVQRKLPEGVHFKACINCLYSDYSPYGQGLFGNMLCFRNIKEEYLRVTSKDEFWAVHGREDRQVQETYLCGQFTLRVAGTGYRG